MDLKGEKRGFQREGDREAQYKSKVHIIRKSAQDFAYGLSHFCNDLDKICSSLGKIRNVRKLFPIILSFGVIFLLTGCKKSSSGTDISQMLIQGGYLVHYYDSNGADHTSSYTPYLFVFYSNDSVRASLSGVYEMGTWGYNKNGNTLTLHWVTSSLLKDLNDTWTITGTSSDLITMTVSGGRELHFKKM